MFVDIWRTFDNGYNFELKVVYRIDNDELWK